ncbi:MAG: hypothetical protein IJW43_06315 [Clostridia bacterium]|nr:hypothetical protein [Clostridia bacterium]
MKKLILKTALITLASVIGLSAVIYGVFALCFPLSLANLFENMGMDSVAVAYYRLNYEKTGDILDLADVCVKIDVNDNSKKAESYILELVEHKDFSSYCIDKDEEKSPIKSRDFFYGKLVVASKKNSGIEKAIEHAKKCVSEGYTEFNPFRLMITEENLLEREDLVLVKEELTELRQSISLTEEVILEEDLELIKQLLA